MKTQLSKLEDVDIRSIWDNETTEFTPWLAQPENIDNISEQIGIDLTVEEKEKTVGPYRADIFCKDEDENPVLIENQLEGTDHKHLGQLLTYAAGLEAVTIISSILLSSSAATTSLLSKEEIAAKPPKAMVFFNIESFNSKGGTNLYIYIPNKFK